jgi:succinoglycan biosynthesis transport protein ExoP
MGDEFSLSQLARTVLQRKRLVMMIVAACVVMAGVITLAMPKIYRAQTSVFFPESGGSTFSAALTALQQTPGLGSLVNLMPPTPGSEAAGLCKAIAESYLVRAEICRDFKLQAFYRAEEFQDATNKLRDSTFGAITPEGVLVIRVDTTDPKLSADIANAYSRIVERVYRERSVARAHGEREFLERRVAQADQDLDRASAELERYQKRGQALLVPEEAPPILQKLVDVKVDAVTAEVDLDAAKRQRAGGLAQLKRLAVEGEGASQVNSVYAVPWEMSAETMTNNPDIAEIRAELVSLEVKLAAAKHDLSPEHPDVKKLQTEVDEIHKRLASEARQVLTETTRTRSPVYAAALEQLVQLEAAEIGGEARAAGLRQLLGQVEAQANTLPARLLRYARLDREVHAKAAVYTTLVAQLESARLRELQEQPVFQVLDKAVPPQRHDRPKLGVNLVVGLLFGLFLGTAIAASLGSAKGKSAG